MQVDVTAASTATDERFTQGKVAQPAAAGAASVLSAAKRQMGAGWGTTNPWESIRTGPAGLKPHKAQVSHQSLDPSSSCMAIKAIDQKLGHAESYNRDQHHCQCGSLPR